MVGWCEGRWYDEGDGRAERDRVTGTGGGRVSSAARHLLTNTGCFRCTTLGWEVPLI